MRRSLSLLAAAVLAGLALELGLLHWMKPLENRLLDAFVKRHAAALAPDPDIVLVNIDEKSLASMEKEAGRWPWPRAVYVDLLEGLAAQKPRAIVFDIMFVERDSFRPQDDAAFGETAAQHRQHLLSIPAPAGSADAKGIRIADHAGEFGLARAQHADPAATIALVPPLALTERDLRRTGLITFKDDNDGVGRRYLLRETRRRAGRSPRCRRASRAISAIAVPDQDDLVLAWRGAAGGFPRVSFSDLYEEFTRSAKKRAGRRVHRQDRDRRHGGDRPAGPARHADAQPASGRRDARHRDREPEERPRHALCAAVVGCRRLGIALLLLLYLAFHRGLDARVRAARWPRSSPRC